MVKLVIFKSNIRILLPVGTLKFQNHLRRLINGLFNLMKSMFIVRLTAVAFITMNKLIVSILNCSVLIANMNGQHLILQILNKILLMKDYHKFKSGL